MHNLSLFFNEEHLTDMIFICTSPIVYLIFFALLLLKMDSAPQNTGTVLTIILWLVLFYVSIKVFMDIRELRRQDHSKEIRNKIDNEFDKNYSDGSDIELHSVKLPFVLSKTSSFFSSEPTSNPITRIHQQSASTNDDEEEPGAGITLESPGAGVDGETAEIALTQIDEG